MKKELEEFRSFLGPLANSYTAPQLRQLRYEMNAMAELLLDLYAARKANGEGRGFDRTPQTS